MGMTERNCEDKLTPSDVTDVGKKDRKICPGAGVAPAVALLLFGASAVSADSQDDFTPVPEPSVLALVASGAAAAGMVNYVRNKRKK